MAGVRNLGDARVWQEGHQFLNHWIPISILEKQRKKDLPKISGLDRFLNLDQDRIKIS
jgi:hypothetical protein